MKKRISIFFPLIILGLVYLGCTKPPDYPDEPQIEFGSWSAPVVIQEADSVWVNFTFTDGDGDIGDLEDDNAPAVFVTDLRDNTQSTPPPSPLPLVPQQGAGNGISGTISVNLQGICCKVFSPVMRACGAEAARFRSRDTVVFEIHIEDQAGNKSNVIQTEPLFLLCQ